MLESLGNRFVIISDNVVSQLHGQQLLQKFNGLKVDMITFPAGEQNKTRKTKEMLEDKLIELGCGADTCLIGLGGGVTLDLTGFLAATYCRGIPHVFFPTSLMAMVDASLGGKTGVNTSHAKNMIGAIHYPKHIWIDVNYLKTLPEREYKNGIVEMIKHALIADRSYFTYLLQDNIDIEYAIHESIRIKKLHLDQNRDYLNFGHTVGHALETLTQYALSHGEAVALGMLAESRMNPEFIESDAIKHILEKYQIPLQMPHINSSQLLSTMSLDKKSVQSKPRFVLLKEIGSPLGCIHVEDQVILDAIWKCV